MSLRLIKGFKYGLLIVLFFLCCQFVYLSYQVVITAVTTPRVDLNCKQIKTTGGQLPAVKSDSLFVSRSRKWPQLSRDNLFATKPSNSVTARKNNGALLLLATSVFKEASNNLALLKIEGNNKSYIVKEGDTIADYQVQAIKSEQVLLANGHRKLSLKLIKSQKEGQ